jgi:DNA-binding transcriptional MerR regulator
VRIGELARRTGVSKRALRYYEEQRLLVPLRMRNGYRVYADDAPMIVGQITALLSLGFNSEATRGFLPCTSGYLPEFEMCDDLRKRFAQRREELDAQVRRLTWQRDTLSAYLE